MGLDLFQKSTGNHVRVGSYSHVHDLRRLVCVAYVIRAERDHDQPLPLSNFARRVAKANGITGLDAVPDAGGNGIAYELFDQTGVPPIAEWTPEFAGLIAFVDHSDCEGEHEAEILPIIVACLDYVAPVFAIADQGLKDWFDRIAAFYREAREAKDTVEFA